MFKKGDKVKAGPNGTQVFTVVRDQSINGVVRVKLNGRTLRLHTFRDNLVHAGDRDE